MIVGTLIDRRWNRIAEVALGDRKLWVKRANRKAVERGDMLPS